MLTTGYSLKSLRDNKDSRTACEAARVIDSDIVADGTNRLMPHARSQNLVNETGPHCRSTHPHPQGFEILRLGAVRGDGVVGTSSGAGEDLP